MELDEQGFLAREVVHTKDGREVVIRPATPEDKEGVERMFRACSSQTLYNRFLSPGLGVPLRYLDRLMRNNPPATLSLIGETVDKGETRVVALLNFVRTAAGRGEIAIVVVDDFQNRGLGRGMLRCLYQLAKEKGMEKFIADVDAANRRVFHLIKKSGLPCDISFEQGVAHAELDMKEQG